MKIAFHSLLVRGIFLALFAYTTTTFAQGTINITGAIRDNTCTLSSDDLEKNVELGTVSNKQFYATGATLPMVPFSLNLVNCGPAVSTVSVTFSGNTDQNNTSVLAVDAGGATGLGVQLLDINKKPLIIGTPANAYVLKPGNVELKFYARYIATLDKVTSGAANAATTFVFTYA